MLMGGFSFATHCVDVVGLRSFPSRYGVPNNALLTDVAFATLRTTRQNADTLGGREI
jgi:hypothetical protein